eukprot:gb/GEZN01006690.1/.p1 GENE.gb/GEZN01006690.1/~~gb/GEZN01006690.1/.p1  ORF type:complete len:364 (+),score=50.61 gb/GEZN01006690.1/:141-1232(+)
MALVIVSAFMALTAARFVPGVHFDESAREIAEKIKTGELTLARTLNRAEAAALPSSFDSATNWPECAPIISDIRDQSNCGCCWAFAAAEAASDRLCIATAGKVMVPLSSESLCFCASSNGCQGGTLVKPWEFIAHKGLVTGAGQGNGTFDAKGFCSNFGQPGGVSNNPHCHHHGPRAHTCDFSGASMTLSDPYPAEGDAGCPSQKSQQCPSSCDSAAASPNNVYANNKYSFKGGITVQPNDADTIASAIMMYGPVEAAFTVYSDFEEYTCGIYQKNSTAESEGGHAVKIVGWGEENGVKYWKVQNSWNPTWGEAGYFRIIKGVNECAIESQVTSSSPKAQWIGPDGYLTQRSSNILWPAEALS